MMTKFDGEIYIWQFSHTFLIVSIKFYVRIVIDDTLSINKTRFLF
jgi:hypothetical protein